MVPAPMAAWCGSSSSAFGQPRRLTKSSSGISYAMVSEVSGSRRLPSPEFWASTTALVPPSSAPAAMDRAMPSLGAGT